jgi:hypothetical protein
MLVLDRCAEVAAAAEHRTDLLLAFARGGIAFRSIGGGNTGGGNECHEKSGDPLSHERKGVPQPPVTVSPIVTRVGYKSEKIG